MENEHGLMVDITHKKNTLRIATAQAIVRVGCQETIDAIQNDKVPKGDIFEMSKAAGLLGVKKTPELLPDCHPIPLEYTGFSYQIEGLTIAIKCTVKTIYKTGVEVEAMHGASIAALNMYDMLKPIDKQVSIEKISLLSKEGGKSSLPKFPINLRAAVFVCSDSIAAGKGKDKAGKSLCDRLAVQKLDVVDYQVIPDDIDQIQAVAKASCTQTDLIVFTGGTGISPRDNTPKALEAIIEKRLPGVEETMRAYGQNRTPVAMFSRSIAGIRGNAIILALPGSTKGATESLEAIFPSILHLFDVLKGKRH